MNATSATITDPAIKEGTPEYRARIKKTSGLELAANLLETAMHNSTFDVRIQLSYALDSGILESCALLKDWARALVEKSDALEKRMDSTYPLCRTGGAAHLVMHAKGLGLAKEVDFYRQEIFWRQSSRDALIASEELIRDMYHFYREVVMFIDHLDVEAENVGSRRRFPEFRACPNPYQSIIRD